MLTGATTDYMAPDAPVDYGTGRRCENGASCETWFETGEVGKVNRYAKPMGSDTKGPQGPLLCGKCGNSWVDKQLDAALAKEAKRQQRVQVVMVSNLRKHRRRLGISQKDLGRRAGINDSLVSDLETGKKGAGYGLAHNLARALGVSYDELRGKA